MKSARIQEMLTEKINSTHLVAVAVSHLKEDGDVSRGNLQESTNSLTTTPINRYQIKSAYELSKSSS